MTLAAADKIDLGALAGQKVNGYQNTALTHLNDHVIRLSTMTEDYFWHYHPNSDETFLVVEGILLIDLETETIELHKGQMITVPKNLLHRTRPKNGPSVNITVELNHIETVRVDH